MSDIKKNDIEISNLAKNCNEALILATLSHDDYHGYQLAIEIEEKSGGLFKFNHGTLYPILHKLEKDEVIKGFWKTEGTKRKRKYYRITRKGKKYADTQMLQWQDFIQTFLRIIEGEK